MRPRRLWPASLQSNLQRDFRPIFRNPHLLTVAGNFWPRKIDEKRFPAHRREYQMDARNRIVVLEQQPSQYPLGHVVVLHGLEGSARAGYMLSFAQEALVRGFAVHRVNHRSCGGSEELCETLYHSGLTGDARAILESLHDQQLGPAFLVGFSLGGNIALKLAGELGETAFVAGVCAVSTPIDLARCAQAISRGSNAVYARRFISRLRDRVRRKSATSPDLFDTAHLELVKTIWEFDDHFTAPLFGFGSAENYYATQSATQYLHAIRVPTLVICAKDAPLVPFEIYNHPAFLTNPALTLLATEHGGHLGFFSRRKPRFWVDNVVLDWISSIRPARVEKRSPTISHIVAK